MINAVRAFSQSLSYDLADTDETAVVEQMASKNGSVDDAVPAYVS